MVGQFDFEERIDWLEERLEPITDVDRREISGEDDTSEAITWYIDSEPEYRHFIGTSQNQRYFDIIYQYNLLMDVCTSLDSDVVDSIIDQASEDEIEDLVRRDVSLSEEMLISPEELIERSDKDLDRDELFTDEGDAQEDEETPDESIVSDDQYELNEFERDWIAANIRLNNISDEAHENLMISLVGLLSEDILIYSMETTEDERLHQIAVSYRLYPSKGMSVQDLYEATRIPKVTGHYARHYLRYAFRLNEPDEGSPDEFDSDIRQPDF